MTRALSSGIGLGGNRISRIRAAALREAMVKNPYVKVLITEGYYDLATPYFAAANYTIDHLKILPLKYRGNISYATFESGHMVYLSAESFEEDESG